MYANQLTLSDSASPTATIAGWDAPKYALDWNDVVQITYARTNYAWNQAKGNSIQREWVTKTEVGAVIDAYRKTRANQTTFGFNPADNTTFSQTVTGVQNQLGRSAPPKDKVAAILKQFYYGVFGDPQQIPPAWYTAGQPYETLTGSQRIALDANRAAAEDAKTKQEQECGIFCSIKRSIANVFSLPGDLASGVGTASRVMSIAIPVVVVGGTVWVLWVLGRKVLELDSTEVASTVGSRGLNKLGSKI